MVFQYERKIGRSALVLGIIITTPGEHKKIPGAKAYKMDLTTCFNVSFVAQWEWNDPFSNQGGG